MLLPVHRGRLYARGTAGRGGDGMQHHRSGSKSFARVFYEMERQRRREEATHNRRIISATENLYMLEMVCIVTLELAPNLVSCK